VLDSQVDPYRDAHGARRADEGRIAAIHARQVLAVGEVADTVSFLLVDRLISR